MGAEQQIGPVAHRLADGLAEGDRPGDVGHGGFMAAPDGIGAGGVEFDGGKALIHKAQRGLGGHFGRQPELGQSLPGSG